MTNVGERKKVKEENKRKLGRKNREITGKGEVARKTGKRKRAA